MAVNRLQARMACKPCHWCPTAWTRALLSTCIAFGSWLESPEWSHQDPQSTLPSATLSSESTALGFRWRLEAPPFPPLRLSSPVSRRIAAGQTSKHLTTFYFCCLSDDLLARARVRNRSYTPPKQSDPDPDPRPRPRNPAASGTP